MVLAIEAAKNTPEINRLQQLKVHATAAVERTKHAVITFLDALPAESYRLQLVRPDTANVNIPHQSRDQILKSIEWLKRENLHGANIYIRPEDRRYILIDDVAPSSIERMKIEGLHPCAITETSRGNYQAWVRIIDPDQPEPTPAEATTIAAALARSYDGDKASADHAHVGRLPGYTNRKPERLIDGKAPFVLLREATTAIARTGRDLLSQARSYLAKIARQKAIREASYIPPTGSRDGDPVAAYRALANSSIKEKAQIDWSAVDFRVSQRMALSGWSVDQIRQAIEQGSPNLEERKGASLGSYAARTAQKAVESGTVQKELQRRVAEEQARQQAQKRQEEQEAREADRRAPHPRMR